MEVLWCRICETNRKPSYLGEIYFGCNVCGLVLRIDELNDPESPPKKHPVHTCAQNLGVCLYIGCRANGIPIMLFDLSMDMRVSVYSLGLVFLDVCEFLTYEIKGFRPPIIVDPVFFIHLFMIKEENHFNVLLNALRILSANKSNYVGTRKRLGGFCAAAVYMAAHFNGLDVDNVVPAFQDILSQKFVKCSILKFDDLAHEFRRVAEEYKVLNGDEDIMGDVDDHDEFTSVSEEYKVLTGNVDAHDFTSVAEDYKVLNGNGNIMGNVSVLCPHTVEKFCHVCFSKFVKLSGYFNVGSDEAPMVLCDKKRLSSLINFDVLHQVFGDDVAQSTNTKSKESNGSSNAIELGQAREENWGDKLANGNDAQGIEDSANQDEQREEVLVNKVRRRFGQPKRPRGISDGGCECIQAIPTSSIFHWSRSSVVLNDVVIG
ncbi:hypothetical protein POM88_007963 [Heracleum sosnowskyi]|uniref:Uncharacterized protein n=1 Tax=Heracleum sosnowskyi TaxID=360622 RepID=A0AAD8N1B0_9APIA|nr:hypothetical protein POM88_007963 [Heracleum sosnowskyi]